MSTITKALDVLAPRRSRHGEPVWELAKFYPLQGEWTEDSYLRLTTNRLVEFSDGCLEFPPMPTIFHQLIVKYLLHMLDAFVPARAPGLVLFAPLPTYLWPGKYREPDILYLSPERCRSRPAYAPGADLVMEILSGEKEDRERDLVVKREEYARAHIAEYWIVDPRDRRITVLTLDGNEYRVHGEFGPGATATSVLLNGFSVSVDAVFAAGEAIPAAEETRGNGKRPA